MSDKKYTYDEVYQASLKYFNGNDLAAKVFVDKYALKDKNDNYCELTPFDMHNRLAKEFARIEANYINPMSEKEIFDLFDNFRWVVPQGSPMSAIGNPFKLQSAGNCFVIESPTDSYGGICKADQELAQLMKRRAGVGLNISNIRPKGQPTNNAAHTTDGIGVFMERFSNTCREVAQGGRRGALLLAISVHHPEIRTFINIKKDKKKVTGANVSVLLTNEFMSAVEKNEDVQLRWPVDSNDPVVSTNVSAKELWNEIIESAWSSAEPGLLFYDNIKNNSIPHLYKDIDNAFAERATNPCFHGEERFLTKTGYVKFIDSAAAGWGCPLTDNRISYKDDSKNEKEENWLIDLSQSGTSVQEYEGGAFITKEYADLLELKFSNGQSIKCTPDHHIATTNGMVEAQYLTPEHDILVSIPTLSDSSIVGQQPKSNEEICAFLMGLIAGDGTFDKKTRVHVDLWGDDAKRMSETIKCFINQLYETESVNLINGWDNRKLSPYYLTEKDNKIRISSTFLAHLLNQKFNFNKKTKLIVPEVIFNKARCKVGQYYISGLYYADGSVQSGVGGTSVRLAQSNEDYLKDIQLLLHANGISSSIYLRRKNHVAKINGISYKVKDQFELITTCGTWREFGKIIDFNHPEKDSKLQSYVKNVSLKKRKVKFTNLTSIKNIPGDTVYCIKESKTRSIIVNSITTRRCGEIPMGTDSCRLLLLNVFSFVKNPFSNKAEFDFDEFYNKSIKAQRLMDDLVDLELELIDKIIKKIKADPEPANVKKIELDLWKEFKRVCINGRRTGLGVTAVADAIAALNIQYGSDKSVEVIEKIYKTMAMGAHYSSVILAKERGAFPIYDYNLEKKSNCSYLHRIWKENPEIEKMSKKTGRRNIALTTTAPCGTVSMLTQTSSGIEPVFLVKYTRRKKINPSDQDARIDFVDELGDKWQEFDVYHHHFKTWMEVTGKSEIEQSPYFKSTSNDINWVNKVKIQGAAQKWISHAISNTTNLPKEASKELVSQVYLAGYKSGCKGVTVYRDGSRSGVLISEKEKLIDSDGRPTKITVTQSPKRPNELIAEIHNAVVKGVKWTVLIGMLQNEPYELFMGPSDNFKIPTKLTSGKIVKVKGGHYRLLSLSNEIIVDDILSSANSDEGAWITRMMSVALRHGVPIEYLTDQLSKDGSIVDVNNVLARLLKKYVKKRDEKETEKCPQCGSHAIVYEEGCKKCSDCGHSQCGG